MLRRPHADSRKRGLDEIDGRQAVETRGAQLLFAHDHRFHHGVAGELYTLGSFPSSVWERYLAHFDRLLVVARDGGSLVSGMKLARADHESVSFRFLPSFASLRRLLLPSRDAARTMREAVEASDAVVARLPSELGLLAIRCARELRKPYAVEVVGCAWDVYRSHGALSARLYAPLMYLRMKRAVARAPLALYVTSSWLQQRYPTEGISSNASNVAILPMDTKALTSRKKRLQSLKRGRRPVLGTIASLRLRSKGVQTALAALSQLRASGLDFSYRVLGPGDKEPWQRLAQSFGVADLVRFDGTRSAGEEVSKWLDDIDIHLQPSFQEGLPRATIEAMVRGVACIGSTCGGIPELLPPERTHAPGDIKGLAACIAELANDPDAIGRAVREDLRTAEQYRPEDLAERRNEIYGALRAWAEENARAPRK